MSAAILEAPNYRCEWDLGLFSADAYDWAAARLGREPQGVDLAALHLAADELRHVDGNLLTTAGVTRIASLVAAAGGQGITNTSARIGVGNGVGTAAVGDTDLSASSGAGNRQFAIMDATFPTLSAGTITLQSTFGTGVANFLWNEMGIDVGTPTVSAGTTVAALLVNHKTALNLFTKTSSLAVVATATITFS